MEAAIETPAAAPEPVASAASPPGEAGELSLDQIIASAITDAPAPAVETPAATPAAETPATPAAEAAPETETPAEDKPADDVTAARVRKMLADVEKREQALTAREQSTAAAFIAEFLKSPKAALAKHGKSIDDVIDASLAEGAAPAAPVEEDRLTALEKRIEAREQAEKQARHDAMVANRKAEIHRDVIAAAAKFPVLAEVKRPDLVTDFMQGYYEAHGKPCTWEFAAAKLESDLTGTGIAAAKKLGWAPPAKATPAAAAPAAERPGTVSIGGAQSAGPSGTPDLPEDPEQLLRHLVAINGG